jgi:hypothetical protein
VSIKLLLSGIIIARDRLSLPKNKKDSPGALIILHGVTVCGILEWPFIVSLFYDYIFLIIVLCRLNTIEFFEKRIYGIQVN